MRTRQFQYYACDFETTVYEGQTTTEVWAACIAKLFDEADPLIYGNIHSFFDYVYSLGKNVCLYFHNLKFDGAFIVDWLFRSGYRFNRVSEKEMHNGEFKCSISQMGQWYNIIIKKYGKIYEIRDSLKLLPFTLKRIGESFQTEHKKLEMEYVGFRYPDCPISEDEQHYIKNDVLVLKEALEIMFNEGHDSITIGSCCLKEFKKTYDKEDYQIFFPNLYDVEIDPALYGVSNAGEYIRRSYRGGWCYLKQGEENVLQDIGATYDVNSLYPSMMSSESGNRYPVGLPKFWRGEVPPEAYANSRLYFVRFTCRFQLKNGYLPMVQIKRDLRYKSTEYLETSDVKINGEYHRYYRVGNEVKEAKVTLTMTSVDFALFREHYEVYDLEIHDGCYFNTEIGLFDEYINYYKEMKMTSTGARRELAKLFLNNLYGKEAASDDSSYKEPYYDPDKDCIRYRMVEEHEKEPGYIAIGSFITSYSRNFTIRAAQANYDNFIYSDTDSIHLKGTDAKDIRIDPVNFCCWKKESVWDEGLFVRQKTYIEHVCMEGDKLVKPYYDIKCAGMPKECKSYFLNHYDITDFHVGLSVPGKLRPKRMHGGILLVNTTYEMK